METIRIRTSERSAFNRCPQKWYWSYVEGLKPLHTANPLWFGSAIHEGLAEWYKLGTKRGPKPWLTFTKALEGDRSMIVQDGGPEEEAVYEDARELGIAMLKNYVAQYGNDEDWDIIATEMPFKVKIRTSYGFVIEYVGVWDGVFINKLTGEIWLLEHKTAARLETGHLGLDNQAGSYLAVAERVLRKRGVLKPGMHIAGIMYNILKKDTRDNRPVNPETGLVCNKPQKRHYIAMLTGTLGQLDNLEKLKISELEKLAETAGIAVYGDPSKQQPPELLLREPVYRNKIERKKQIERIKQEALYLYKMRKGDPAYPIVKSVQQFGISACSRCPFYQLCQLDEQGDDMTEEFKAAMFKKWDPYEDHRKAA